MAQEAPAGSDKPQSVNILLVDDEPRNLLVLESLLGSPEYRLVRAESGNEALLALMTEDFAVLVLDVQMPGMSGFELAQIVKSRKKTASLPIIFLSAYFNDDQHVLEGYGSGAVDYLQKPVNPAVLRSKVAVFAELHRKQRELASTNQQLREEIEQRRRAEATLAELNASLDGRVAERTAALEESEARLRDADRRKDEFLATLAHELRNPLAPVRNAVHALRKMGRAEPRDVQWASEVIERQVSCMSRLIEDLMDISRINQGRFELRREIVDLHGALDDALEIVQPSIVEFQHVLQAHKAAGALWVDGDRARIAQAVVNLLSNAVKYTERGGRITVRTRRDGPQAVLTVTDSGIGIAPARLETVFEMFSQEEAALSRSRGGVGIGLALTRKLVEMHGGRVRATSEGPGLGSEFEIAFPLAPAIADATEQAESPPGEAGTTSLRILIADDNQDAADTLRMLLEVMGHSVLQVADGESAVCAATTFDPQLVLLDIGMPKLNGYEACERIRNSPGGAARFVAAITGWGQPQDVTAANDAGFDRHVTKPIAMEALSQLIERAAVGGTPMRLQPAEGDASGCS